MLKLFWASLVLFAICDLAGIVSGLDGRWTMRTLMLFVGASFFGLCAVVLSGAYFDHLTRKRQRVK